MMMKNKGLLNKEFFRSIVWIFSASGFTVLVTYLSVIIFPLNTSDRGVAIFAKVSLIGIIAISTHVIVSWFMKISEAKPVIQKIKKYILRPIKIQ